MVSRVVREIRLRRRMVAARGVRRQQPARQQPPKTIELAYLRFMLQVLDVAKNLVRRELIEPLPRLVAAGKLDDYEWHRASHENDEERLRELERTDSPDEVRRRAAGLRVSFDRGVVPDARLEQSIRDFGQRTADYQGSQLQRQIRTAMGIEVPLSDPRYGERLRNWTTENVGLIKSIPGDMLDEVERELVRGVNDGTRWEVLASRIEQRFGVAERRAALIARDQVGKFYGSVQRARQTNLGIKRYIWRTSRDERVRPEHVEREGEIFEWADPPEDGHPGQPINCRCTAEPILEDLLDELEADEAA